MKNPFANLNELFKTEKPPERRLVRHPQEKEIIEIALNNLSESALGKELVDFVKENNIKISVLRGRNTRDFAPTTEVTYISVADDIDINDPEITINMVASIRGAEQEADQRLRSIPYERGESLYVQREEQKLSDILQYQAKIVYELGILANKTEFIDSFTLMGYYSLIEAYENDLKISEAN